MFKYQGRESCSNSTWGSWCCPLWQCQHPPRNRVPRKPLHKCGSGCLSLWSGTNCVQIWQQGDYLIHDYLVVGCQEKLRTAASLLVKNSLCLQPPPENQGEGEERKRMRLRESKIGRKNSLRSFCMSPGKGPLLLSRSVLLLSHPSCHIFWDHFQGSNKRLWFMQYRSGPI